MLVISVKKWLLVISLELVERILGLAASLGDRDTLEVGHEEADGRLELLDVRAFHLFDDEPRTRATFLYSSHHSHCE